jgi:predicted RND superfamily exporter protein
MLILIYPKDFSNQTLDEISNVVDGSSMDIKVTGSSYLMRDLNSELAVGQLNSSIIALVAIFILMLISLRSLVIAFIATVPIIVTVIFMYGFLGLSGISLNIITATIFSITIGVGIDYAVHYTSVFRAYKKEGLSSNDAALKALHYTERPIIANAFGVSIGLSALFVSPLLIHNYVSILMWVSMICSVFLSLSFLPTLLKLTK